MTTTPPLLKPRHTGGRLMAEDEIRGLDGDALLISVAESLMGWVDILRRNERAPGSLNEYNEIMGRREHAGSWSDIPEYHADIAAAFTVDRPNWRWEMEDYDHNHFDVAVYAIGPDGSLGAFYDQRLDRKPTPQDYARARCVAALLLAAKIGE